MRNPVRERDGSVLIVQGIHFLFKVKRKEAVDQNTLPTSQKSKTSRQYLYTCNI